MNYFTNPAVFQNCFQVPKLVAENHLKLATPNQLRVLLYVLNNLSSDKSEGEIAIALSLSESDVSDALGYWAGAGVFVPKSAPAPVTQVTEPKRATRPADVLPTRREVARLSLENPKIADLIHEADKKFGRGMSEMETRLLVWLYNDEGMDISLILMLLEYAKSEDKLNSGFIKRTAVDWINKEINTIPAVEKYISDIYEARTAWKIVESAFGIDDRIPSTKELSNATLWVKEWGFNREMLFAAYEKCVDTISEFNMSYTAKILKGWHESGYKTLDEVKNAENEAPEKTSPTKKGRNKKSNNDSMVTYDINEIEKLFNSNLEED